LREFFSTLLWVVFIVDSLLLVLIVLLQSGRGGGLSGMLGGGGGESALGPRSGLNKITGWMAGIFFAVAILIGLLTREPAAADPKEVTESTEPGIAVPKDQPPEKAPPDEGASMGATEDDADETDAKDNPGTQE
jgi:preprotein translocase subunit SecG